uniref:Phosphatidylinositol-specific phospholipase C X domain-containing protein n=1 Tax=viral metagenome TaxID=1070528 RepID=A0A6C0F7V7_9ZZZZ
MTVFKLILLLLTIFISILLVCKLLSKRVIIEGAGDPIAKKNDMDAVTGNFAPAIIVPAYIVKASHPRPPLISDADRFKNSQDKMQLILLRQRLRIVESQYNSTKSQLPSKPTPPKKPTNRRDFKAIIAYSSELAKYNVNLARYNVSRIAVQRQLDELDKQIKSILESIAQVQLKIDNFNSKVKSYIDALAEYNKKNDDDSHKNYRLKDFFVKSSYNSAFTGNYMNSEMVKLLLNRGCRFLDFEIVNSRGTLYVTDSSIASDRSKQITLSDALSVINRTLTKGDPVFINLRLQNAKSITYDNLKSTLNRLQYELRYTGRPIDDTTRMSEIQGKCITIANYDIKDKSGKSATDIVANKSETGLCTYENSVIANLSATTEPGTKRMTVVEPNSVGSWFDNPDISVRRLVLEYKVNFTPQRFYKRTDELTKYENIFNAMKSPYIAIKYLDDRAFDKLDADADVVV